MDFFQKSLVRQVEFEGIGVHSGSFSSICIKPASANHGIVFKNSLFKDVAEFICIGKVGPLVAMHATVLKASSWKLSTVEHLMAACSLFGLDNLEIEVTGFEIPILDGSALPFVQAFNTIGIVEQKAKKNFITPLKRLYFEDKEGRFLEITPHYQDLQDHSLYVEYVADFSHPLIGVLSYKGLITQELFENEIAPARTFGFLEQLTYLRHHKLAQGSTLGNTAVMSEETYLNDLRFPDECVRHKVLDLLGDLALLGNQLVGTVRAAKTSHSFNRLVTEHFLNNPNEWRIF